VYSIKLRKALATTAVDPLISPWW